MDLRETIDDGHAVNLFVVLGFDVLSAEELENRGADLDAIAVAQTRLAHDLLVVDVRAIRGPVVDAPPGAAPLLEVRVTPRHAVALEDDVILGAAADARGRRLEEEAPAEEGRLFRVDDHEAVVALRRAILPKWLLHDGSDSSFLLGLAHARRLIVGRQHVHTVRGRPSLSRMILRGYCPGHRRSRRGEAAQAAAKVVWKCERVLDHPQRRVQCAVASTDRALAQ